MQKEDKGSSLYKFTLFNNVSKEILDKFEKLLIERSYTKGDIIFKEDSEDGHLYLIKSGSVKIIKSTKIPVESVIGILHEGDFFGELELIDDLPRSATAIATSDTTLLLLDKKNFYHLLSLSINIVENLLKTLSIRLRSINETFVREFQRYIESVNNKMDKFNQLIEAAKIVNSSLELDQILSIVLANAISITKADRGTVYLIDKEKNELWSKVLQGENLKEIRIPIGVGIAGIVAQTGEIINISNAYEDKRFNPEIDKISHYETRSILCVPMKNREDQIVGVFQLLNKKNGTFDGEDENYISAFSTHAAIAIENATTAQKMIQNERLASVGRMASTIIHDIKNPLSTMRLYTQILRSKVGTEETVRMANEIIKQIDRFIAMTQEILDFSKGEYKTILQEVDIEPLFESLLNLINQDCINKNINLSKDISYKGKCKIDPNKISRVIYNLTGNAIDAMQNGGNLIIKVYSDNTYLFIEVTDTGIGMTPEIQSKVFEPFFSHGKKHGTGLGMAIVKKIIDEHKGTININSELNKGTKITVKIPLNES